MSHDVLPYSQLQHFHHDFYKPNRPVVIRGIRDHQKLKVFDWSVEYFEPLMGDVIVPVMTTNTGFLSYERNFSKLPFREFSKRVFECDSGSGTRYYYKNPTSILPSGHDDSGMIKELAPYLSRSPARNLWISGSGLTVGLHFDPADNLNFQLCGSKTFWLYPPGISAYYPLPMFSQTAHISAVFRDGAKADLCRFPKFNPDDAIRIELHQGDVLYLPAYWWHQVESVGHQNVNLNFWWFPRLDKQLRNWNQALRGHAQVALRLLRYGNIQQAPADKR